LPATVVLPLAELAVSVLAAAPLIRQLSLRPLWRHNPCKLARRLAAIAGYGAALLAAALWLPLLLHVVAGAALVVVAWEWWRARPDFGRARGLPPGSLVRAPTGPARDQSFFERQIAAYGPVFKMSHGLRPLVCIEGHGRGIELLRAHDAALRGVEMAFNKYIPQGFLRYMHPSVHGPYRKLFHAAFSPAAIDAHHPAIAAEVRAALAAIADDCLGAPGGLADPSERLRDMLFAIFVGTYFGIRPAEPRFEEMRAQYRVIDVRREFCPWNKRKDHATAAIFALLRTRFEEMSAAPAESPPALMRLMAEAAPDGVLDDTVLGNFVYIVEAGLNDLQGLMRWLLKFMLDHPQWLARLRAEEAAGAAGAAEATAERLIKEVLRLEQSEYLMRRTTQPIEVEGYRIPKNWVLRICIREANRNGQVFERPDAFDPDRFGDRAYAAHEYATFGLFRHNCLGAHLTQVVNRGFLMELARAYELVANGPWSPECGVLHWQPQAGYRLGLRRRAAADAGKREASPA